MSADASVRAARYGGGTKKSEFWKKVAASHAAGKANAALDQMKKINKHRTRIAHAVKKTFEDKKEGQMANWMDDDVRESVIDALIETELYEKKSSWTHPHQAPPTAIQRHVATGKGRVSSALAKGREAASSAVQSTRAGARRAKVAVHKATPLKARVKVRRGMNAARSTTSAVRGAPKYASSGVKSVASGARDLVKFRKGGASAGRGDRVNAMRRADAVKRMKGGAGGAALATAGAAAATYGAYRGGKALVRKYKNRKNKEESYTPREYYHAVVENLFEE